jgi:hypothetical protein
MGSLMALALGGRASTPQPLTADVVSKIKQGNTAVLFHDDIGEIKYLEDQCYILAVAQIASNVVYADVWSSNSELSQLHAEQFSNLGLKAQSAYTLLPSSHIEENSATDRARYTLKRPEKSNDKSAKSSALVRPVALTPQLRDALLAQGQDSVIWVAWSGLTLHLQTFCLPAVEKMQAAFWIFDLQEDRLLWNGTFSTWEHTSVGDRTGKEFLESNNLSGLKSEVAARMRDYYDPVKRKNKDVGALTGFRGVAPGALQKQR